MNRTDGQRIGIGVFEGRLTMITGPDGDGWDQVRSMPPIAVLRVGQDLPDPSQGNQRRVPDFPEPEILPTT